MTTEEKVMKVSRRCYTWVNRDEALDRASPTYQKEAWLKFLRQLKLGSVSADGAWWMVRALFMQRGKTKLGFEELEQLTHSILTILDSSDILQKCVLPMPLIGPDAHQSFTVSFTNQSWFLLNFKTDWIFHTVLTQD